MVFKKPRRTAPKSRRLTKNFMLRSFKRCYWRRPVAGSMLYRSARIKAKSKRSSRLVDVLAMITLSIRGSNVGARVGLHTQEWKKFRFVRRAGSWRLRKCPYTF